MDLTTFGVTITTVGMGGTLASLWFLTIENILMIAVGCGLLCLGIRNMNTTYFISKHFGYNSINDKGGGGSIWKKQKRLS